MKRACLYQTSKRDIIRHAAFHLALNKKYYQMNKNTASKFKACFGSYICADILQLKREAQDPSPSDRNAEYYAKRPCARCVAVAAEIVGKELFVFPDEENSH